jgi:hypothetical protein
MSNFLSRRCADPETFGFNVSKAQEDVWAALLSADVFVPGEFKFVSGIEATLKADCEQLYSHPRQLEVILGYFATHPCVIGADVLLYVPEGMRDFVTMLGEELNKPVAHTRRREGSVSRTDFVYSSPADQELALAAENPWIGEDVVTKLGSTAAVRAMLRPEQDVHSLAILRRCSVDPANETNLVTHYLVERDIPTDKDEFTRRLWSGWN